MGSQEVGDFLDVLAEAIYETQGKSRVKLFELDDIFPLVPLNRMHFDYEQMVYGKNFNTLLDELANEKALSLSIRLVSDKIVKNLSTTTSSDDGNTTDFIRKMFLDSGKSIDTSRLSSQMLESFERTILERPEVV